LRALLAQQPGCGDRTNRDDHGGREERVAVTVGQRLKWPNTVFQRIVGLRVGDRREYRQPDCSAEQP
jgi:hypothetical protein